MVAKFILTVMCFTSMIVSAALPPYAQNTRDLDTMVDYVKRNKDIADSLVSINLVSHTIVYGKNCQIIFQRSKQTKPKGWVGPLAKLVVKERTCGSS
ncbi:MAG: hypothetical protein V2I33_02660 [Kangiellaceae bacterium]|jgi:hypothetical protein|nr:hypothetical protein [Kangiellaceae bacterium]